MRLKSSNDSQQKTRLKELMADINDVSGISPAITKGPKVTQLKASALCS